jgi:hypothetical protein
MKDNILEAIVEGANILNSSGTDKDFSLRVNDTMQLLLKALKSLESNKLK